MNDADCPGLAGACFLERTMSMSIFAGFSSRTCRPLRFRGLAAVVVLLLPLRIEVLGSDHLIHGSHSHAYPSGFSKARISRFGFVPDHLRGEASHAPRAIAEPASIVEKQSPTRAGPSTSDSGQMFLVGPTARVTGRAHSQKLRRKRARPRPVFPDQSPQAISSGLTTISNMPTWARKAFQSAER